MPPPQKQVDNNESETHTGECSCSRAANSTRSSCNERKRRNLPKRQNLPKRLFNMEIPQEKKKMPPKKKQKRTLPPSILAFMNISVLSKDIAKLKKQENQYKALLQQVFDMTDQPTVDHTEENITKITTAVILWLENIQKVKKTTTATRDEALKALRTVDVLDDEALKGAALILTETETRLAALDGIENRWGRVVRYKETSGPMKIHSREWLERFFSQWAKTHTLVVEKLIAFRKVVKTINDTEI